MAKITSKYQVSIPKVLADQLRIKPGDEIDWAVTGGELRIAPRRRTAAIPVEMRLEMFDAAAKRQAIRDRKRGAPAARADRGWTREDLYDRGRTR